MTTTWSDKLPSLAAGFAAGYLTSMLFGRQHNGHETIVNQAKYMLGKVVKDVCSANQEVLHSAVDQLASSHPMVVQSVIGTTTPVQQSAGSGGGWFCSACTTWNSETADLEHVLCSNTACLRPFMKAGVCEGVSRKRTSSFVADSDGASKRIASELSRLKVQIGTRLRVSWKKVGEQIVVLVDGDTTSTEDVIFHFEGTVTHTESSGEHCTVLYDVDQKATIHKLVGPGRVQWEHA